MPAAGYAQGLIALGAQPLEVDTRSPAVFQYEWLLCCWLPVRLQRAYARTRASVTGNYVA